MSLLPPSGRWHDGGSITHITLWLFAVWHDIGRGSGRPLLRSSCPRLSCESWSGTLSPKRREGSWGLRKSTRVGRTTYTLAGPQWASPALLGGGRLSSPRRPPQATSGKRKSNGLDLSYSGSSIQTAAWRPETGPLPGVESAPLRVQEIGKPFALGRVVKSTVSTGEQTATSGRKLSYAEDGAAYIGVVARRLAQGANAGLDSLAPLTNEAEAFQDLSPDWSCPQKLLLIHEPYSPITVAY
jgi:hypothetical protein